jgi:hypothetical protein
VEALQSQFESSSDPMQKSFAALMLSLAAGDPMHMNDLLRSFPIELMAVGDYATQLSHSS